VKKEYEEIEKSIHEFFETTLSSHSEAEKCTENVASRAAASVICHLSMEYGIDLEKLWKSVGQEITMGSMLKKMQKMRGQNNKE
jgi:hypothetical protein